MSPKKVRNRHFVTIQAFIDDSYEQKKVLILAGYIASADQWTAFSKEWFYRLDQARWTSFHMVEIGNRDPKKNDIAGWFYRAVEDHVRAFVAIAVEIEPLHRVVRELDLPSELKNPYIVGMRALLDYVAQLCFRFGSP